MTPATAIAPCIAYGTPTYLLPSNAPPTKIIKPRRFGIILELRGLTWLR